MTALMIGGAASGKSALAEALAVRLSGGGRRIYLATMDSQGAEALRRIEKHRAARAGKGFETVECPLRLEEADIPPESTVLLECLGNLCANELFGGGGDAASILRGVEDLGRRCRHLVIVSNEVGSGGWRYAGDTLRYLRTLGQLNCALAAQAEGVCEVACGIPVWHKGGEWFYGDL